MTVHQGTPLKQKQQQHSKTAQEAQTTSQYQKQPNMSPKQANSRSNTKSTKQAVSICTHTSTKTKQLIVIKALQQQSNFNSLINSII
jgi:translation initiation factor 1 (eIF-1/SUI1)